MKSFIKPMYSDSGAKLLEQFSYDISSISWLNENQSKISPRAVLNEYKILIMLKGTASIHINGGIHYAKSCDCVLFSPGSLYHAEISNNDGCQFIAINFSLSSPIQDKNFQTALALKNINIYSSLVPQTSMKYIFHVCRNTLSEKNDCYYNIILLLKRLIGEIFYNNNLTVDTDNHKITASEEKMVLLCHKFILNNCSLFVTVDMLCDYCNVSQSYLYKCFKNVLGISTKSFITDTKLEIAQKDLLKTNKTISEIAMENGYSNSYQFSNLFKKAYGISPSSFRKEHK